MSLKFNRRSVILSSLTLPLTQMSFAQSTGSHPVSKRIVFVVSNLSKSPTNGMDIGFWLPEIAHPWWAFSQKGYDMTIASPNGGAVYYDKISDPDGGRFANPSDFISLGFKVAVKTKEAMQNSVPLKQIKPADYDAIFVIGGLAPPVTFNEDTALQKLFADFYEAGKITVAICHGTVVLLKTKLSNGKLLADGKKWTGYTNLEEDVVDKAMNLKLQPFRIEDEAKKIEGTSFIQGEPYKPFAVTDGRLITGQQGSSGMITAEYVIKALEVKL
jgi:putative intracellular protease/amidase